ncbi:MAG TPA: PAS domain S-box protein [Rhodocyclaceae bacterium]|nr:PAS domain S-box protein [Rhodocyclaceae bacterium]
MPIFGTPAYPIAASSPHLLPGPDDAADPPAFPPAPGAPRPWRLLAVFVFFVLCIGSLGWWAYTTEADNLRQRQYEELNAIAHFKATQIADWLAERRWDAALVFSSPFSRRDFSQWLDRRDWLAGERLKARLQSLLVNENYAGVELLDPTGAISLAVGPMHHDPDESTPARLAALSHATEPQLIDLHRHGPDSSVLLAYVMPIAGLDDRQGAPIGYLWLIIDPEQTLYPLIQSWPTPSPSAETLIVRRDGNDILYLNDLRHRPDTAMRLRQPLTDTDLPAARAVLGHEGIFEGHDYRGIEVISFLRAIPGTPWRMVTKVDRSEVFSAIRQIAQITVLASLILLALAALLLWLLWRRQQMAARLQVRQELERIADVSPGVIHSFCLRPDGSTAFPYASPAIQTVYGYGPEQLAADAAPIMARVHPDDAERLTAAAQASARDLSPWQAEFRYSHPSRGEIWVEEKSVPTRQADGTIVWHGFLSDITERKRIEQALRESEARFSTVFRDSPLAISISGIDDGLFIEVNDAFLRTFDESREDVIGHTSAELGIWADPADRARIVGALKATGTVRNAETRFRRRSGEVLDILYSVGKTELDGHSYLLSMFADVTSLRRAEQALAASRERYRLLFEHMLDGCALGRMRYEGEVPVDFLCLDVNPAFAGQTGVRNLVGKWASEVLPGIRQGNPDLFNAFGRVARSGRSERLETYVPVLQKWFSISVFSTEPEHFAAIFDNITERKQAQLALEAHRQQLEAAVAARTAELVAVNKELQAFTYAASHDLKAPLRGISGFATLLERDYLDRLGEDGARYLEHICRSAARMTNLIDDLLAYARLEQQTQQVRSIDLPEAVHAILAERHEEIRQLGAEVRTEVPEATVRADSHGLAQVLRNLVGNALKYSAKVPHPAVHIGGELRPGWCRLWVRDNGVGFDMAYHDRIFEIFRRLHSSQDFQGTGVGLALVKKAMERMGGRVWAESAPGQGATFYLELPVGEP